MSNQIVIYGFETSNNFKVRVALGFKGIDYTFETIEPGDRADIVKLSGQPLTPVMVHDAVVLFDSGAILRYLEAMFPDTPKLFANDYDTMRAIDAWEAFGRAELHRPLGIMVAQRLAGISDEAETARAAQMFDEASAKLEEALSERQWLVDGRMTAADVTCGAVLHRTRNLGAFELPDHPATRAYAERVMAFDAGA